MGNHFTADIIDSFHGNRSYTDWGAHGGIAEAIHTALEDEEQQAKSAHL